MYLAIFARLLLPLFPRPSLSFGIDKLTILEGAPADHLLLKFYSHVMNLPFFHTGITISSFTALTASFILLNSPSKGLLVTRQTEN